MRHGQDDPGVFPPGARIDVVSLATKKSASGHCPATRWSVDDLVVARCHQASAPATSRSALGRILDDADLKPHRSVYWLNSHGPDFDTQARDICSLYVNAFRFYQAGRVVLCVDDKTGMQILQRKYPTRRFLKRDDFCLGEDFATQLYAYLEGYNTHEAHPYRWTYTGQPLVRATPFSQTRRQQWHGRAWFRPRPQRFVRALYPPRPYKRAATQLVMNLCNGHLDKISHPSRLYAMPTKSLTSDAMPEQKEEMAGRTPAVFTGNTEQAEERAEVCERGR
jgi:hypothetical protein